MFTANLDQAIACYQKAVARLPLTAPDRPSLLNNLGSGRWDRYLQTGDGGDLAAAVTAYQQALEVTPTGAAVRAPILGNLANAVAEQEPATLDSDHTTAGQLYREAVVSGMDTTTGSAVAIAENWARWAVRRRLWGQADEAYRLALTAMDRLWARQLVDQDRAAWLLATQHLPTAGAAAAVRVGHRREAVLRLETGRALSLSEILQRDHARLEGLDADPSLLVLASRFRAAASALRDHGVRVATAPPISPRRDDHR